MAQDAGVVEERLAAGEGVEVGAADADAVDADEGFAGAWSRGGFGMELEAARFFEADEWLGFGHGAISLVRVERSMAWR